MYPIKAIILDVDGVIVGEKIGFNSPHPHPKVINKLKKIRAAGIPICLCTAKPHYSVEKIISDAGLKNLHITQGGGVLINPLEGVIYKKSLIDPKLSHDLARAYINNNTYIEFYSLDNYFIQANQKSHLTQIHSHILQKKPTIVANLPEEAVKQEIVKFMPIAKNEEDKKNVARIFEPFKDSMTLSWGIHPIALPHQFGIITAPGISKRLAVEELSKHENIKPSEILAVGDSKSDWQFMEQCEYAAAMGNASKDLKDLVLSKKEKGHIGKSVDENGILDIFRHFGL